MCSILRDVGSGEGFLVDEITFRGHPRSSAVSPSNIRYDFLLAFHTLYRGIGRKLQILPNRRAFVDDPMWIKVVRNKSINALKISNNH